MNTLILNSETANLSIGHVLSQVKDGGTELRDSAGKIVAVVLSPADKETLI
jgi:hypothetical protein